MSKTTVFLILLVVGAGLAIGIFTNFNPVTSIQNFIENPSSLLPSLQRIWQTIQQNIVGFGVGTIFTIIAAARYVSGKVSEWRQKTVETRSQASEIISQVQTENSQLTTKVSEQQESFTATVSKLSNQLADTQQDCHTTVEQLKTVTDERTMFVNKYNATAKELEEYKKKFGTLYIK